MSRSSLRFLGILFWVAIMVAAAATAVNREQASPGQASAMDYMIRRVNRFQMIDESGHVQLNDPVFLKLGEGEWTQVGHIDAVSSVDPQHFTMLWHDNAVSGAKCEFTAYRNSGRLDDAIATMFPLEKRLQIRERLERTLQAHGDELMQSLIPVAQRALQESLPVIEAEFRRSSERHRVEIDDLMTRWNDELVEERLIPLARREVIPIIREHGQPVAETIGRELWDRASIWRFGWRAAYDRTPLPRRDLVQQEWDRFVEEDAIPVFDQHMDEIVAAVQQTIAEITANQAVTGELAAVINELATDDEALRLLRDMLKESIVDNPKLHEVWQEVWQSDQATRAFDLAGARLEPVVRQIGDDLFGTREKGINPDFARVLRNQILGRTVAGSLRSRSIVGTTPFLS